MQLYKDMADYADEAHRIVDAAIENACKRLVEEPSLQDEENKGNYETTVNLSGDASNVAKNMSYLDKVGKTDSKTLSQIPNITWMSIEDFTVDGGLNKIENFIEVCVKLCYTCAQLYVMGPDSNCLHHVGFSRTARGKLKTVAR